MHAHHHSIEYRISADVIAYWDAIENGEMSVDDNSRNILFVTKTGVLRNEVSTISCICSCCIGYCAHACLYVHSVTAAKNVR
jgi:hypothetical protein